MRACNKYYTVLYPNNIRNKSGHYSEIIGYDSIEDATDYAFEKTNGKIAAVDIVDVGGESIYSVENGVVIKETKKKELENYFNFVVSYNGAV